MDPYNWQAGESERQRAARNPALQSTTGPVLPLREKYLRMFDQPHNSAHLQRLARAYEALPQQRRPSTTSQPLNTVSTDLYGSLPSAGMAFSMSPPSYGPMTTEPSSLGADGMAMYRASMEAAAVRQSQSQNSSDRFRMSTSIPRSSTGWPMEIPERALSERTTSKLLSASLPERAMSDQAFVKAVKRSSTIDIPQQSSNHTLFPLHPPDDVRMYPQGRRMSTSVLPSKLSKSPQKAPVRLSRVAETSSEASESSASSSSSSIRQRKSRSRRRPSVKTSPKSKIPAKTKKSSKRNSVSHPASSAYTVLGVDPDCSQAKLREVFRTLTDKLDEMMQMATTQAQAAAVQEKAAEVRRAYASVSDRKLRAKYDRWLEGSSPSATSSEDERRTRKLADKSLYDIIGIDRRSTVEEIKEAAQSAIDYYNSIKDNALNEAEFFSASKAMNECQRAWRTLGSAKLREEYDKKLRYGSDYGSEQEELRKKAKGKKRKDDEPASRETSRPSSVKQASTTGKKEKSANRRSSKKYETESESDSSQEEQQSSRQSKGKSKARSRRH